MKRLLLLLPIFALFALGLTSCDTSVEKLYGAGDIASCGQSNDTATGNLMRSLLDSGGQGYSLGDNAYDNGSAAQFRDCYDPAWGSFKGITRPSPGNHDYSTSGASGYFDYFGSSAAPDNVRDGNYFYDVGGDTRVFSLNTEANQSAGAQFVRDTGSGGRPCVIAYGHKALVSSGNHGNQSSVLPLWQAVYDIGGDLMLAGHDHSYERFAPLNRDGGTGGRMREIVSGTGGQSHYSFNTPKPGSEVRNSTSFGVLELDLTGSAIRWQFHATTGSLNDSGTQGC